ncbi:hypothetical protein LINPERPRIM_LOCUS23168 [Linum perenne]
MTPAIATFSCKFGNSLTEIGLSKSHTFIVRGTGSPTCSRTTVTILASVHTLILFAPLQLRELSLVTLLEFVFLV